MVRHNILEPGNYIDLDLADNSTEILVGRENIFGWRIVDLDSNQAAEVSEVFVERTVEDTECYMQDWLAESSSSVRHTVRPVEAGT